MGKRKLLNTSKGNSTEYDVKQMFAATKTSSAHCVIQLSRRQANILSPNKLIQMEMQCGIANLSNYIPLLPRLISPIIDIAFNLQQSQGYILLKEITGSKDGLWQTSMCVNAETQQFHTECDCTYTLIHVSQQVRKNNPAEYYFNFNLMKERTFSIQMKAGTSILFSGSTYHPSPIIFCGR